ncbi:MAG: cyclic 2,3-diphosphoglycerate synthase, partial [Candidatus Geothermarchaeales archaeon]
MKSRRRVIIMGAAGRDFHNFNTYFRQNPGFEVVAFTATQIPGIANRLYPPELSGLHYPEGIPIEPNERLDELVKGSGVDIIVLAYSDLLSQQFVDEVSSALSLGPDFMLLGPENTTLRSKRPVISVCAVRTGAGKSTVTRRVCDILREKAAPYVVVRHPMPYGDLRTQIWQRFETLEDMDRYGCTIEEREEYEPHIRQENVVYAGVDYGEILERAEEEIGHDGIIVWDGGNNDLPFIHPDLHIVVTDPFRAGDELSSYPGQINLRLADVVVINKADSAPPMDVEKVRRNVRTVSTRSTIIEASSRVAVDRPELVRGKRVLVIEDGPTLTHGGLTKGAGMVAAENYGASEIVDPRPAAVGSLRNVYEQYPHIGFALPALGYGRRQVEELANTIAGTDCETVIMATPTDLRNLIKIEKSVAAVSFELSELEPPTLLEVVD